MKTLIPVAGEQVTAGGIGGDPEATGREWMDRKGIGQRFLPNNSLPAGNLELPNNRPLAGSRDLADNRLLAGSKDLADNKLPSGNRDHQRSMVRIHRRNLRTPRLHRYRHRINHR